jgi:hypothetical protein
MSDSMPARLAGPWWQPRHRHRWCWPRKSAYRLSCLPCQDQEGGSDGRDDGRGDGGSLVGDEPEGAGVGVGDCAGSVQAGEDSSVGATFEGAGSGDDEELVGVGVGVLVGVLVGGATGQVAAFVFV